MKYQKKIEDGLHLRQQKMEVELNRQKTYYDKSADVPAHSEGEEVFVFSRTVKSGQKKNGLHFAEDTEQL